MKAIDLMIGDWVLAEGKPLQVTNVSCLGGDIIRVMNPIMSYDIAYASNIIALSNGAKDINKIEPIPLTPEILEKNGFVPIRQNAGEPYYWQYFDKRDGSIVNAFRRIYRGLWIECSNATTEASTNKQCEFVHELQHAIKNTEIKMEVVL